MNTNGVGFRNSTILLAAIDTNQEGYEDHVSKQDSTGA